MTLEDFKAHLAELHRRSGDATMMYNCARQLGADVFAFSYDALCTEIMRFNSDGTIEEWCDAAEDDWEHYEAHFVHANTEEWMRNQLQAVACPI